MYAAAYVSYLGLSNIYLIKSSAEHECCGVRIKLYDKQKRIYILVYKVYNIYSCVVAYIEYSILYTHLYMV